MMTPPSVRRGLLGALPLLCAVFWLLLPVVAHGQLYPKEYIRIQPTDWFVMEGQTVGLNVEFAYGSGASDQQTVYWYKNGVLVGRAVATMRSYTVNGVTVPITWDPYANGGQGQLYDGSNPTAVPAVTALACWTASLNLAGVTPDNGGVYYARVGANSSLNYWNYTNFAQIAVIPQDPLKQVEIVRQPQAASVSAPYSTPLPGFNLFVDPKSHVTGLLHTPFGAATDTNGFTYIADTLNHVIRRVSPGGHFTTVAGMDGQPFPAGYTEESYYASPSKPALTRKERDPVKGYTPTRLQTNQSLNPLDPTAYRFLPTKTVVQDMQTEPLFNSPEGIAISDLGVLYVADTGNDAIRRITTDTDKKTWVDTVYGEPGSSLKLRAPRGVYFYGNSSDPSNNPPSLYVVDSGNYAIKRIYLDPVNGGLDTSQGDPDPTDSSRKTGVELIANQGSTPGWQGVSVSASEAKFYAPRSIVVTKDPATSLEVIYIADTVNQVIRRLYRNNGVWVAETVVGFIGAKGNVNAVGKSARLNYPVGLAIDEENKLLYFTEFGTHSLRRVYLPYNSRGLPAWSVDLVAGSATGQYGPTDASKGDGAGSAAFFYYPAGISYDKVSGSVLLADSNNNVLRKVTIDLPTSTNLNATWLGSSAAFVGSVGTAGNRDFANMQEFTYQWLFNALEVDDVNSIIKSSRVGSRSDTLAVSNAQYDDAGVYACRVKNVFERQVESSQAGVYVATQGDPPKFLSPGYRITLQSDPTTTISDPVQNADIFVFADVQPAQEVTYQWEIAEDTKTGDYTWIPLADLPLEILTKNDPKDPDTAKNALRVKLGMLLGTGTVASGTSSAGVTSTISGSTTSRLSIKGLQKGITNAVPPALRFRVKAYTKASPPLPLDTKLETIAVQASWTVSPQTVTLAAGTSGLTVGMILDGTGLAANTTIRSISADGLTLTLDKQATMDGVNVPLLASSGTTQIGSLDGTWTAAPDQLVTVDDASGLSVGMFLAGSGLGPASKIRAIDTSNPAATVLTLDSPAISPGTKLLVVAGEDVTDGASLTVKYPAALLKKTLSYNGTPLLTDQATQNPDEGTAVELSLTEGDAAYVGNPLPTLKWKRRKTPTSPADTGFAEVLGGTLTLAADQVTPGNSFYYYLVVDNGLGTPQESNSVLIDVVGAPSLVLDEVSNGNGTFQKVAPLPLQNGIRTADFTLDKTVSSTLDLTVRVVASTIPSYKWSFNGSEVAIDQLGTGPATRVTDRNYGQLTVNGYGPIETGTLAVEVTVSDSKGDPAVVQRCQWNISVLDRPQFTPGSKVFRIVSGTSQVDISDAEQPYKVDLDTQKRLLLQADFVSPTALPITKYLWRRDRTVVQEGLKNYLEIPVLSSIDMGTYRLEVTNAKGTVVFGPTLGYEIAVPGQSKGWSLTKSGVPSILLQPVAKPLSVAPMRVSSAFAGMIAAAAPAAAAGGEVQHVGVGQRLALQVAVDGTPAPTIEWFRSVYDPDKQPVWSYVYRDGTQIKVDSSIYIYTAAASDVGKTYRFKLRATNQVNGITKTVESGEILVRVDAKPERLEVLVDPLYSSGKISDQDSVERYANGGTITFGVQVSDAGASYQYQWKLNGASIRGAVNSTYTVSKAQSAQSGQYSVVVSGVAGSSEVSYLKTIQIDAGASDLKYNLTFENTDALKTFYALPVSSGTGMAYGTAVSLAGIAPSNKMLQHWRVTKTTTNGLEGELVALLPARKAQFTMPDYDVTVSPVLSRTYAGNYSGLLSVEPLFAEDANDPSVEWSTEASLFRPVNFEPKAGNVRGYFVCTVSPLGAVSGQIQLENKLYSFTTVLDSSMKGTFSILTTLKGTPWRMEGTLKFNPTDENRLAGFVDNLIHFKLNDALMSTPPLIPVGQTLYGVAGGNQGSRAAVWQGVVESLSSGGTDLSSTPVPVPLVFTSAAYRESGGNTRATSMGQGGVFSLAIRQVTGLAAVTGYLPNGTRVTFSTYVTRGFVLPDLQGPDAFGLYPELTLPQPFSPVTSSFSGQAQEAVGELLLRKTSSAALPLWFRGDQATQPVYGALVLSGPKVIGSIGALFENTSSKLSEYIPNVIAGYYFDPLEPHLANIPSNQFVANQFSVTMTTPDTYPTSRPLVVTWPTPQVGSPPNTVLATVDRATGLMFGGILESTTRYVGNDTTTNSPYSPKWAGSKSQLACTVAGVVIQNNNILPNNLHPWTPSSLGGYVGFLYRGKFSGLDSCQKILGNDVPETAVLNGVPTNRIDPFLIQIQDSF